MLTLCFYAPESLCLKDAPKSTCEADEVKIRVKNHLTCGTDTKICRNGHQSLTPSRIIGYEAAGKVIEVGSGVVGDWKPGDRVQIIATISYGKCHECRKGRVAICQNQTSVGYQYGGGLVEHMIVPREVLAINGVNRTPNRVGFAETSAAEPFVCAINAQKQLGIELGDDAVIFGAGPIGCLHVRIIRGAHRAGRVILVGISSERLKMSAGAVKPDVMINASEVNIVEGILKFTGRRGTDVIITATPTSITQEQAVSMAIRNRRINFFGGPPKMNPTTTLDSNLIHYRQLHIHGTNGSASEHNRRVLDYIASGKVPAADFITRHIRLYGMMDAFGIVERGEAIRVTVEP